MFNLDRIAVSTSFTTRDLFLFCLGAPLEVNVSLERNVSLELASSTGLKTKLIVREITTHVAIAYASAKESSL